MNERHIMRIITGLLIIMLGSSCRSYPGSVPTGTWKYRLLVNGADIGIATSSNKIVNGAYVSTMEMEMDAGYVKNFTRQIITETLDFRPLKLEIYNKTINEDKVHEVNTVATFNGQKVELVAGDTRSTFTIDRPFRLEGNFFMHELIKNKFKPGTLLKTYIYEPTIEIEEPILMMIKVIGREKIAVGGKLKKVIHLGYTIENFKNIDLYIDDEGITQRLDIIMLNNRLELIIDE